jgi:hypothetical protein
VEYTVPGSGFGDWRGIVKNRVMYVYFASVATTLVVTKFPVGIVKLDVVQLPEKALYDTEPKPVMTFPEAM